MADVDITVNESIAIEDTAAKYEVGASSYIIETDVFEKDIFSGAVNEPFFVNAPMGSVGVHTIKEAPGAGKCLAITQLTIVSADENVVRIGSGEQCGWIQGTIFGPYAFNTEASAAGYKVGSQYTLNLKKAIKLPENKALTGDVSAAGYTITTIEGLII